MRNLILLRGTTHRAAGTPDTEIITLEELKEDFRRRRLLKHLLRYRRAKLLVREIPTITRPFILALALRLFSRGQATFEDDKGNEIILSPGKLLNLATRSVGDFFRSRVLMASHTKTVGLLLSQRFEACPRIDFKKAPLYLRTDMVFGLQAGGMITHMTGVINNLEPFTGNPFVITTDFVPGIRPDIDAHIVPLTPKFWDFPEFLGLSANAEVERYVLGHIPSDVLSFVYQRYSLNNYTGLKLASRYRVPFVLEYNGSEVWMQRHWRLAKLVNEQLSWAIEMLNLTAADVVVVVSRASKEELIERGIVAEKVLVNPNGVELSRFHPDRDGGPVRQRYGLSGKIVIGFIGTFGPWHGAQVLAEAYGKLLMHPAYRETTRLMLIGDGLRIPAVKSVLTKFGILSQCIFTGAVPHQAVPGYLAACDIFSSPHVPNLDQSRFFGSPTKLFEYMAMGKSIIASDLEQIGEILDHDRTAWLVKPGNSTDLANGLRMLIENASLRARLGLAAQREAMNYTWYAHTKRMIDFLRERFPNARCS